MSPRACLSHIRCTRAYDLILHTNMKFSEISVTAGFCCSNDMCRKLREYYGMTPTEIRFGKNTLNEKSGFSDYFRQIAESAYNPDKFLLFGYLTITDRKSV